MPIWSLVAAVALIAPGLWWGMPSEFSSAVDAPGPYSPLAFVANYRNPALAAIYPATHQLLLLVCYSGVFLWLLATGGLRAGAISASWPHGFADPVRAFSALIVAGRMLSAAMAAGLVASLWRLSFTGWTRSAAAYAAALLLGSGVFIYYSRTTNVDVPYVFWWVLSFLALWRYVLGEGRRRHLVAFGVLAAIAVGSKTQAVGLVLGSALALLVLGRSTSSPRSRLPDLLLLAFSLLAAYMVVAVLPQPMRWLYHVRNYTLTNRAVAGDVDQAELALGAWSSLLHVLSAGGVALAALGVVHLIRARLWRVLGLLLFPAATYYALIVATTGFVPARFMLPLAWLLAIPAGYGVVRTAAMLTGRNVAAWVAIVCAAIAYHVAVGYVPVTLSQTATTKARLSREIGQFAEPGSTILWVGARTHLPDARVYSAYELLHGPREVAWTKATEHAIAERHEEPLDFVLAQSPQDLGGDAVLVNAWTHSEYVRRFVKVRSLQEYYLYEVEQRAQRSERRPESAE